MRTLGTAELGVSGGALADGASTAPATCPLVKGIFWPEAT